MADRGGERLLSAFRAANCPGVAAWTGSDLDWVYEIPGAEEFLDRLASSLNAEAGPPGQPRITHDKVITKVCGNMFELVELYSDSTYRLVMTVTTKFVVITTNFLL